MTHSPHISPGSLTLNATVFDITDDARTPLIEVVSPVIFRPTKTFGNVQATLPCPEGLFYQVTLFRKDPPSNHGPVLLCNAKTTIGISIGINADNPPTWLVLCRFPARKLTLVVVPTANWVFGASMLAVHRLIALWRKPQPLNTPDHTEFINRVSNLMHISSILLAQHTEEGLTLLDLNRLHRHNRPDPGPATHDETLTKLVEVLTMRRRVSDYALDTQRAYLLTQLARRGQSPAAVPA